MLNQLEHLLRDEGNRTGTMKPRRSFASAVWPASGSALVPILLVAMLSSQSAAGGWRVSAYILGAGFAAVAMGALVGLRALRRIEAKLAERTAGFDRQSNLLSLIFNTMTEGVIVCDNQRNALYANPRARQFLGINDGPVNLRAWMDEHPVRTADSIDERPVSIDEMPLSRALKGETCEHVALRIVRPADRDDCWLESSALPLRSSDGSIIGALAVFHDATESKRMESERSLLASVVSSSADAVISLTPDGRISSWNPASEWLFGFREAEAIGQSQMIFVPPSRVTEAEQLAARMRDGETVKGFETSRRRKNGSKFPVLLSVAPIFSASGHILGYSEILQRHRS